MPTQKDIEKVRFVGKHSKDTSLSIYLQKRNIYELETGDGTAICEPLGCIVRVKGERLGSDKVVVVGVLARLICDFGLQYTEHVLYQLEAQMYPRPEDGSQLHPTNVGGVFDFDTRFVTALPDSWHIPFLVRLPRGLPPSIYLRNAGIGGSHWGLSYYVFAYITNARAVSSTIERHGIEGAWPRMRLGRRHSKVFLSFSKTNVALVERICRSLPPSTGMNKRKTLLSSGSPLLLEASLDKTAYYAGEPIQVTLRIRNAGKQRVTGVRITLKQLLTVKYTNEPRQVIKSTIGEYEGHDMQLRDASSYETTIAIDTKFNNQRSAYQIALESILPALPENPKVLSASCTFNGPAFNGIPWGIDKLRVFNLEYYVNVHAVIPWSSNLIVKLPLILVSTGGETKSFNVLPIGTAMPPLYPLMSSAAGASSIVEKPGALRTSVSHQPAPPHSVPLCGNLISFDLEYDDGDGDHGMDDELDDAGTHDDCGAARPSFDHPVDQLFPTSGEGPTRGGVRWREDITAAKSILESAQTAIQGQHRRILEDKLDRRSLALAHATRRHAMNRALLEQLNGLLTQDLPSLKSSLSIATKQGGEQAKFSAAQATAFRLASLGSAHADLVPLSVARNQVEEHLEAYARVLDDFELFLVRAGSGDEAGVPLDRIGLRCRRLIADLPGYPQIERLLKRLARTIARHSWATIKSHAQHMNDDDSDDDDHVDSDHINPPTYIILSHQTPEERLTTMALQFQALYDGQVDGDRASDGSHEYDAFPKQLVEYGRNLTMLLESGSSEMKDQHAVPGFLAVAAYFHWRFFLAICEHFYLGGHETFGGTPNATFQGRLLLFSDLCDCLRWSPKVEALVPARFLLPHPQHQPHAGFSELEDVANQIVAAMQNLL